MSIRKPRLRLALILIAIAVVGVSSATYIAIRASAPGAASCTVNAPITGAYYWVIYYKTNGTLAGVGGGGGGTGPANLSADQAVLNITKNGTLVRDLMCAVGNSTTGNNLLAQWHVDLATGRVVKY